MYLPRNPCANSASQMGFTSQAIQHTAFLLMKDASPEMVSDWLKFKVSVCPDVLFLSKVCIEGAPVTTLRLSAVFLQSPFPCMPMSLLQQDIGARFQKPVLRFQVSFEAPSLFR